MNDVRLATVALLMARGCPLGLLSAAMESISRRLIPTDPVAMVVDIDLVIAEVTERADD